MYTEKIVDKLEHFSISLLSEDEKSNKRIRHALEKSVNTYTEINIETMRYRHINLHNDEGYTIDAEGDYPQAYEYMCNYEIDDADALNVRRIMAPDVLRKIANDSNGVQEVVARYRLKNVNPIRIMERRAIFMRDEIPHYVICIAKDVTEEMNMQKHVDTLESILKNVACGVIIYDVDDNKEILVEYVNEGASRISECSKEELIKETKKNALCMIDEVYLCSVKKTMNKIINGEKTANTTFSMTNSKGNRKWIDAVYSASQQENGSLRIYGTFFDCTESREQQLQLMQNQRAVELAQNQGSISIWIFNLDKKLIIQQTSMNVKGHMGYPICIKNVPDYFIDGGMVHPDDADKFLAAYRKLDDGAKKVDELYRLIDNDTGKFNWVHMFYQRMENNMNGERMAVGFAMDASKQQEAIERYHIEQKLRQQIYGSAAIYLEYNLTSNKYEGDNNLPEIISNKSWKCENTLEYIEKLKSFVGVEYLNKVAETLYCENLLKAFKRGESRVSCEFRSKEKTGEPAIWYCATAIMVKRPDNGDIVAFVYIENIENEKVRQMALDSSLRDGIENIAIINTVDAKSKIIRVKFDVKLNDIDEYFVYDANFVERSLVNVVDDEKEFAFCAALLSTVKKKLETQEIYQYSVSIRDKSGEFKRKLFRYRYLDDRKNNIVFSISDITTVYMEERAKKEQLEQALAEVKTASQAKAEFYSRMSHDMRTPMNGILGMTALSEDECNVNTLRENISKIHESGEYLLNLINDTLDIQRIESGKMMLEPKIVHTAYVVNNILDMVSVTAKEKGIELKFSKGNTELNWYIRIDALRLKQILINLLSNAIKFTPSGGTVEIEFKLLAREGMISHDVIYIRDTGIGMSEAFLKEKIFKPFSQESNAVSAAYAGSGLGLSIAKSLVELMNGRIEVESELGVGTKFAVYLDFERVADDDAERELKIEKKVQANLSTSLNGKKILLAEDHPLNAEIAQKLLNKVGCDIIWVQNGVEAVSCFESAPVGTFDAILMDIRMPKMDGLEAARKIRLLDKSDAVTIPIIAMTANAYKEDVRASLEAGMNAHLGKPVVPKDLYEVLAGCLAK